MKKITLFFLPIVLAPCFSACQDKEHSIIPIQIVSSEIKSIELDNISFENLVESGQQFAVEFYSPYCIHCEELNPKINAYMYETKNLIYRFDLTRIEKEKLNEYIAKYPDILPDEYVPAIRFIKNKKLTYEVDSAKFESYNSLRRILNQHFLSSHINIVSSKAGFEEYQSMRSSFLAFFYDLDDQQSIRFAADHLITSDFQNKNMPVLLVNCRDFGEDFPFIKNYFVSDYSTVIAKVDDQKVTKIANYTADDFSFSSFIN